MAPPVVKYLRRGWCKTQDLLACAWYQKGITWNLKLCFKDLRERDVLVCLLPLCVSAMQKLYCMN